jgi:anti-sigma B factor antagonist
VTDVENRDSFSVFVDPDGVIVVSGDIDISGGPILQAVIVEREADSSIVIDLRDVSFIDSAGLRSLLGASRRARGRGAAVTLRHVGAEVTRLLQITGTTEQFVIETRR